MAVKQYIGARYVPLLDGDYDVNKTYEPVTTVNYGNATYTSKKKVPAGIVPTDSNYWMQTGFGNQQVTALLDWKNNTVDPFIQQADSDIGTLQDSVLGLQEGVSNIQGVVTNIQGDVTNIQRDVTNLQDTAQDLQDQINDIAGDAGAIRRAICVTDSYGTHSANNWMAQLKEMLNINGASNFYTFAEGSSGFEHVGNQGHTFKTLVSTNIANITNPSTIDAIFIGGGTNDFYYYTSGANFKNAIIDTLTYLKQQFVNAKIYLVYMGYYTGASAIMKYYMKNVLAQYSFVGQKYGARAIQADFPMHIPEYREDGMHPNDKGNNIIASMIYNAISGGQISGCMGYETGTYPSYELPFSLPAGATGGAQHIGFLTVSPVGDLTKVTINPIQLIYNTPQSAGGTGVYLPLGTIDIRNNAWCPEFYWNTFARVQQGDNTILVTPCVISMRAVPSDETKAQIVAEFAGQSTFTISAITFARLAASVPTIEF